MNEKVCKSNEMSILGIKVENGSRAERVLSLYTKVDTEIDRYFEATGIKPMCGEGCGGCCHEHFPITDIEFDLILCEIQKWNAKDLNELLNRFEIEWKTIMENESGFVKNIFESTGMDSFNIYLNNPLNNSNYNCIFLDRSVNKCMIYNVRPWICRTYGTSYRKLTVPKDVSFIKKVIPFVINNFMKESLCLKMPNSKKARRFQADITDLGNEYDELNIFNTEGIMMKLKVYPIVFNLFSAIYMQKTKFKVVDYNIKFIKPDIDYIRSVLKTLSY